MNLFSYKITHDTGFAPNPFHGCLTLATCKPGIRKTKNVGDWIAGFSSQTLTYLANQRGLTISPYALIYLARVSERMTLGEYFLDARFKKKIPSTPAQPNTEDLMGDNIYQWSGVTLDNKFGYIQIENLNHFPENYKNDIGGKNALICEEFYYLGREGKEIPEHIQISRPTHSTNYGYKTEDSDQTNALINWVRSTYDKGINGQPCLLPTEEECLEYSCSTCSPRQIKC